MKTGPYRAGLLLLALACLAPRLPAEPRLEQRVLIDAAAAGRFSPAESTVSPSTEHGRAGKPAIHWHVTVDYFGGEAKYPIGWPRITYSPKDAAGRDWSGWDYLQLWVFTDTSREALPSEPAGLSLYTPDKEGAFHYNLAELKKNEWVRVRIPLNQVPRHNDVRLIQFNISEARYRHQDRLDFYIDDVVLLRYAEPAVLEFGPEGRVMFADAKQVPVRFTVAGVPPGESREVTCELRAGGRTLGSTTAGATRGAHRALIDLHGQVLAGGDYELVGRIAGSSEAVSAPLRLVDSPWGVPEARP